MIDLSLRDIREELKLLDRKDLEDTIVELAKLNRQNKRSIAVKLASRHDASVVLDSFKEELNLLFGQANASNYFLAKKAIQAIRRKMNQNLTLTKDKSQQVELLFHFCDRMREEGYLAFRHPVIDNVYLMQFRKADKILEGLHDDIRYDFAEKLDALHPVTIGLR